MLSFVPELVIFDLDGTLTDSHEGIENCTRYALEKMGRQVPPAETLRRFLGPPLADSFMRYCGMNEEEAAYATELYRERYHPIGWKENSVFPYVRQMLAELKRSGKKVAVATGKPEKASQMILDYFGLAQYVDILRGPAPEEMHIEKADLIGRVLKALDMKAETAVMVGDTPGDLNGARDAGVAAIGALYGYGKRDEMLACGAQAYVETSEEMYRQLCPDGGARRGWFITLEGVDGCGKSTQAALLEKRLRQYGYSVRRTREPGGCPIAENIRSIVLAKEDGGMCAETEALLFAAARAQHVREVILPAVADGQVVLCDRFVDSSLVYQGDARGLEMAWVREINRIAFREGRPNVTLYLRMPHEEAFRRRQEATELDRIEKMGNSFQARTEAAYEKMAQQEPDRFLPVNAMQKPEEVAQEAFDRLFERMQKEGVL